MPPSNLCRSLKRFFLLLAFVAAIGSSARAQEIVTTPTGSKLEVRVIPEKDKILPGEPIFVSVEYRFLKPEGQTPEKKWKQDVFPVIPGKVSLTIFDHNGTPLARREGQDPSIYFYKAGPDTFSRIFILPEWVKLSEPGAYRIRIETEFTTDGSEAKRYNNDPAKSSMFSVTGEEKLDLLPPDTARLGELINETGPLSLKTDYNREWTRLLLFEDRRIAPFLVQRLNKLADVPESYTPTSEASYHSPKTSPAGYIREVHLFHYTNLAGGLQPNVTPGDSLRVHNEGKVRIHPFSSLVFEVIERLTELGGDEVLQALVMASKSRYSDVRGMVAGELPRFNTPHAFSVLAAMRKDPNFTVRVAVAEGLAMDTTRETRRILQDMLKDKDYDVRQAAQKSLLERPDRDSK